jgi:hypothetical protein
MATATTIPVTVESEAAALAGRLGLRAELEQMVEHARQTVPGLRRIEVRFAPAYDTGEDGILIEALRDPGGRTAEWTKRQWTAWELATFSPDVLRYFTLLDLDDPEHGR